MPAAIETIVDAAFLSDEVYKESDALTRELGRGWELVSRSELGLDGLTDAALFDGDYLYNVLAGEALVARKGDQLALVFRGTAGPFDILVDLSLPESIFAYYAQFTVLTDAFKALVASTAGATGLVTGHSLGGAMAEMFMTYNADPIYEAVTFGSPGVSPVLPGGVDDRVTNVAHSQDTIADILVATGNEILIDLPMMGSGAITDLDEHARIRYLESAEMLLDTGLFADRADREIVLGSNAEVDVIDKSDGDAAYLIAGGDLVDTLIAGAGDDLVHGGSGSDVLIGHAGQDGIHGADGYDNLFGGDGADALHGGNDDDRLYAQTPNPKPQTPNPKTFRIF